MSGHALAAWRSLPNGSSPDAGALRSNQSNAWGATFSPYNQGEMTMTTRRFAVLLLLSLTTAPLTSAQTTAPGDPPFAVRATERLVLHAGARVRGGAVGAFDSSRDSTAPRTSEVTLDGAR